jgi:hypothetical protein
LRACRFISVRLFFWAASPTSPYKVETIEAVHVSQATSVPMQVFILLFAGATWVALEDVQGRCHVCGHPLQCNGICDTPVACHSSIRAECGHVGGEIIVFFCKAQVSRVRRVKLSFCKCHIVFSPFLNIRMGCATSVAVEHSIGNS